MILPVYNVAAYIDRTLASIKQQTLQPMEVIVVDDCSTDDTVDRVKESAIPGLRLLRTSQNSGPWHARNLALEACDGHWIALIDGDDWWDPGRIERLVSLGTSRGADLVMDDLICCSEAGDRIRTSLEGRGVTLDGPTKITAASFIRWNLGIMKPLFRRDFIETHAIRFNGALRAGADFSMFLECLLRGAHCILTPEAMYLYRLRAGQITSDHSRLFAGTKAATLDAIDGARNSGAMHVLPLLEKRLRTIEYKIKANDSLVAARRGQLWTAIRTISNPYVLAWIARRLVAKIRQH